MILLCYDGSPSAKHAISDAHAVLGSQPVTLLNVWSSPSPPADAFGLDASPMGPSPADLEQRAVERSATIAEQGCELARAAGLAVEARLERSAGSEWRTILDVADELSADCIVVGTRGDTAVESALLGSVSNAVVHHATRPVLIVPARG